MLIPSPRHTAADLRLWRELEAADRAHSHSRMLGRNYRRCEEIAKEFLAAGPAYVAVSWGKDSVAVAHLVLSIAPTTPLCWIRVAPIASPECSLVRDAFLKRHASAEYHEIEAWCERDDAGWHATGSLERGIAEAERLLGERTILGIRANESSVRHLRVFGLGPNTPRKSAPLAYLTVPDVFGILSMFDLPIHPAYAMLGGGRWARDSLRVASLGGKRGDGIGRAEWESEYYGDELRRIESVGEHAG